MPRAVAEKLRHSITPEQLPSRSFELPTETFALYLLIFMFARSSDSAPICIRCRLRLQLRLARQSHHRPFLSVQQASQFSSSSSHRLRIVREVHKPRAEKGSSAKRNATVQKYSYPLGRIRGKKNAPLREGTVPLPINSLGEPSKVIILKDAGIKPLPKPSGGHVKQKQVGDTSVRDKPDGASKGIKPSEAEILRAIAEENNVLGPEEVNRQIEGLKPGQGGSRGGRVVLPKDEFDTRASILHDGFTTAQLLGYLDRGMETPFDRMFQELAETEQDEKGAVHRVSRSSWTPGIRPVPQGSSNAAQRPHLPKKMGVVDKILRVNWKIDVLEEIESPGELEISGVQRWQLRLLVAGGTYSPPIVSALAHKLLPRTFKTRSDPKPPQGKRSR